LKYLLIIVLLTLHLQANAEEPVRMGRLFLKPSERASLDALRANSNAPDKVIKAEDISKDEIPVVENAPPVVKKAVVMNGYVSRSDGKTTLWVNDQAVSEKSSDKDIKVGRLKDNQVTVVVNQNKSVNLKPGQVYDPNTGKIYNHVSEMPIPETSDEEQPKTTTEKIIKKLGLEDTKKKVSAWLDSLSAKPESSQVPADNK
jgi:hypothetical protein